MVRLEQISAMLDFLECYPELAHGYCNRSLEGRSFAKRLWMECAQILNCIAADCPNKSPTQWRSFYNEFKFKLMRKIKDQKAEVSATGGGPAKKLTVTPLQERLLNILGRNIEEPLPAGYEDMDGKTRHKYGKLVHQKWIHVRDNYHRSRKKQEQQKLKGGKIVRPKFSDKVFKRIETNNSSKTEESSNDDDTENNFYNTDSLPTMEEESIQPATDVSKSDPPLPENKIITLDDSIHHFNPNNRHISFFYGILPTLNTFDDDEVLEFQMRVLQQLRSIKSNRSKVSENNSVYNVASSQSNNDSSSIIVKSPDRDSVSSDIIDCKNIL